MNRILSCCAAFLMMTGPAWGGPLRVVTTTEDVAAIAREVGGSFVNAESLTRGSQDPHFVEARPSLILKASRADLFIQIGLGLEVGWAPGLLMGARNPQIQPGAPGYLEVSRQIEPLEIPSAPVDRSQGDVHPFGNPHYLLDPENGRLVAHDIAQRLAALVPDQAIVIDQHRRAFVERLGEAIARWTARMKPYGGAKVVTYHKSWSYFARRFGLEVVGYVEPKPGIPPSPAHINHLMDLMRQEKVRLIIIEPYVSRSIPDLLARETRANVLVLPPSVGGVEGVKTYIDLFDHLIGRLTAALSAGP